MSAPMDPELPSLQAAAHSLKSPAAVRANRELKDHATQVPGQNRHSDRVLAFLRKNPGRVEWFQ